MIVKYKGKEAFEKWAQSLLNAETKATKQTKLAKKYELKVASAHYEQWEKAIAKADKATGMNRNKRFDEFFSYFHTDSAETQKDDSTTESEHEEISETVLSNNQSNLEVRISTTDTIFFSNLFHKLFIIRMKCYLLALKFHMNRF